MGKLLEDNKKNNIDKLRIGACLELSLLSKNFDFDFNRIIEFISNNSNLLNSQNIYTLKKQIKDLHCVLDNTIDIILSDIDKNEVFTEYHIRYY